MFSRIVSIYLVSAFVFWNVEIKAKIFYNTLKDTVSRATIFRPVVIDKTCLLKPDIGPCRAEIPMYYYEPANASCSIFFWGGCQGNGNRFDSSADCRQTCLSQPGQSKTKPKWCSLTFDYGFCFGAMKRFYYDPIWKVCKQTIYSGCGGNKNNFYNKEQCDALCNFGTGSIRTQSKSNDGPKKILIVNPWNATKSKGKYQNTATSNNAITKKI